MPHLLWFNNQLFYSIVMQDCAGPSLPRTTLRSLPDSQVIKELSVQPALEELVRQTALPTAAYFNLSLEESQGCPAQLRVLLPPGYRETDKIGFPALLHL